MGIIISKIFIGVSFIMDTIKKHKKCIVIIFAALILFTGIIIINIDMTAQNQYLENTVSNTRTIFSEKEYEDIFLRDRDKSVLKIYRSTDPFSLKINFWDYNIVIKDNMTSDMAYNFKTNMATLKEYVKDAFEK